MRLGTGCFQCLYEKEERTTPDADYLREVRETLADWDGKYSAPYMEYELNRIYERRFGRSSRYAGIKKQFNDLMLERESTVRQQIEASEDPLKTALFMARIGNYIDFGAMKEVDPEEFLRVLLHFTVSSEDEERYASFLSACASAKKFLLLADNAGEIILDKLFLEQLMKRFPTMDVTVMVRGKEILNDATTEDADYVGLTKLCKVVSNGEAIAGTEYFMLSPEAKAAFDAADLILSKGQGNYESVTGSGKHVFFSFLCKCDVFMEYFDAERFAGMLIEEIGNP